MSLKVSVVRSTAVLALGLLLTAFAPNAALALSPVEAIICIKQAFNLDQTVADLQEGDVLLGVGEGEAKSEIESIKLRSGVLFEVKLVPCGFSENANAYVSSKDDGLPDDYTSINYIIYNKTWLFSRINTGKTELDFVLGHEFGHLINHHATLRQKTIPDTQKELEADYAGACAVARMNRPWGPLKAVIEELRSVPSEVYPRVDQSLKWAEVGYKNCNGVITAPLYKGASVLYFFKDADNDQVINVLKENDIPYQTRKSKYSIKSNGITCTPDFDFKAVRELAMDLTNAGVEIYWINKAIPELNAHRRITIEAETDLSADWKPLTVEQLSCMKVCRWWTTEVDACAS
ncbi:hypothetical protein FHX10_004752 [Rhizobium sp. BK591]|uniref:hypothetical protein n=1 Tax=Rhizobium sp. BK591 TaxID=2586985 RepID=UPI001619C5D0|nr:hypothetical protein [Rhizobium sp. BK591]MBB3745215.1 hypothetical protein [Rhizobium sp. BK591]